MARQVAHEIKNPLTPMKLAVQHLRQTYRDRAPQFGEILETVSATVIEQIDTLSRIASEFSTFARMPGRRLEVCDVGAVLREAIGLFEQEPGVRWRTDVAGDLQQVRADREELRRAFINVFRNAIQAMNGQGELSVDAEMSEGSLRITIRDTGPGIPEEIRPKLFLPNFSTKTDGMGLGLAIVKKTIDDLGGSVRIESGPGPGTAVIFELPTLRAEA
jgi:nitrogen fixation/metabolism regulation signal transduction histidine kinase